MPSVSVILRGVPVIETPPERPLRSLDPTPFPALSLHEHREAQGKPLLAGRSEKTEVSYR
jgi:hypothetical protein